MIGGDSGALVLTPEVGAEGVIYEDMAQPVQKSQGEICVE